MSGAYAFEIPIGQPDITSRLIEAVPSDWSWIDGQLDAPLNDIADGKVARAGWKIDRFHDLEVATLTNCSRERWFKLPVEERAALSMYRREATLELIGFMKQPLFIQFNEAGFDQGQYGIMPFHSAKRIAAEYVKRGFIGDLFFHSDCYDNCGSYNPERCDIHLAPYTARWHRSGSLPPVIPFSELIESYRKGDKERIKEIQSNNNPPKPQFPALIKIEWEQKYGGKEERIAGILETCRELKLTELDPEPIEYGTSYAESAL